MSAHRSGIQLTAEEQIEIFGTTAFSVEYAVEAEERWGDTDAWKQSRARVSSFTKQDWIDIKADNDALLEALAQAKRAGVEPGSADADELAARHRASIERYYDCGDEMHRSLVEMYLADERFTRYYDDVESGLAQFVHDIVVESLSTVAGFDVSLGPMSGQPPSGTVTFCSPTSKGPPACGNRIPRRCGLPWCGTTRSWRRRSRRTTASSSPAWATEWPPHSRPRATRFAQPSQSQTPWQTRIGLPLLR